MSYTEACFRCTTPKPSETNAPSSPTNSASCRARANLSASSLLVSRGSNLTFSRSRTSPSVRPSALASASGPTTSPANCTCLPSSSPSAAAEMGDDNDLGAGLCECVERGYRGRDAAWVGDVALVVQWHVEIGAHENPSPRNPLREKLVEGGNRDFGHLYSDFPTNATRSTSRFE